VRFAGLEGTASFRFFVVAQPPQDALTKRELDDAVPPQSVLRVASGIGLVSATASPHRSEVVVSPSQPNTHDNIAPQEHDDPDDYKRTDP